MKHHIMKSLANNFRSQQIRGSVSVAKWMAVSLIVLVFTSQLIAQDLEVEGQAKIMEMNTDNSGQNVVIQQSDGTLAVRDANTLMSQNTGSYGTVVNPATGKVWLDRNLGASQVATSPTDAASYGDLYQWGRGADGHQLRTSLTTATLASDWLAGSGSWSSSFITIDADPDNWLITEETHMWSGTGAENNPCPSGFRLPTNAEWEQERLTWSSYDADGAFASPLKLPKGGGRSNTDGSVLDLDNSGFYWSSTVSGSNSRALFFGTLDSDMFHVDRAVGFSVRCIKD